jgi:hypothetical protein
LQDFYFLLGESEQTSHVKALLPEAYAGKLSDGMYVKAAVPSKTSNSTFSKLTSISAFLQSVTKEPFPVFWTWVVIDDRHWPLDTIVVFLQRLDPTRIPEISQKLVSLARCDDALCSICAIQ